MNFKRTWFIYIQSNDGSLCPHLCLEGCRGPSCHFISLLSFCLYTLHRLPIVGNHSNSSRSKSQTRGTTEVDRNALWWKLLCAIFLESVLLSHSSEGLRLFIKMVILTNKNLSQEHVNRYHRLQSSYIAAIIPGAEYGIVDKQDIVSQRSYTLNADGNDVLDTIPVTNCSTVSQCSAISV